MDSFLQDLRYAVRALLKYPLFTSVATLALALGIGANTAIFSVVNTVLLRSLPYDEPDRVVMIWNHWEGWPATWISEDEYWDFTRMSRAFVALGAFNEGGRILTGGDTPERVRVGWSTATIFAALGARAAVGRVFTGDEDRPGGPRVAVISHGLWQRRFGGERSLVGRTILLNDSAYTVVGVMPADFQLPLNLAGEPMDLWAPLQLDPANTRGRGGHYLNVVGRLAPGITMAAADADVATVARRMVEQNPGAYSPNFGSQAVALAKEVLGRIRPALFVLLGAVGFVLLIACANVANLLLARSETRHREIAVRAALGAGRGRIVRQLLTESVALFLMGGVLGLALAFGALHAVRRLAPESVPRLAHVSVDAGALLFTLGLSLATGVLFGLIPATHATADRLHDVLREGRGMSADRGRQRARRMLVVGEIALALVLVAGAGLLIKSFARLRGVDPGFDPMNVLTMQISLPSSRYTSNPPIIAFYEQLMARVQALPGVQSAGAARMLPMTGALSDWAFHVEGRATTGADSWYQGDWEVITPGYFKALGMRLAEGRFPSDQDDERSPRVIVINETLARRAWPDGGALGARVKMGGSPNSLWHTVIGIVRDVHTRGLDTEVRPELFLVHSQFPFNGGEAWRNMVLAMRTRSNAATLTASVRRELRALDPNVPLSAVRTMDDILGRWAAERRLTMLVLALFASVALALAAVGIYAVMSYTVAQRTQEIGIRMALGATAGEIIGLVVRQAVALAAAGIIVGLAAALALTRLLRSLLFEVSTTDPTTFIAISAILALTAVAATYVPARRATRVEPTAAMRS